MQNIFKSLSLAPRGLRHKLVVAFALMSVIPTLVCGYFIIYYIFPSVQTIWDISLIFGITLFLIFLGFYLAQKMIIPIIEIAVHAKSIAEGNLDTGRELQIGGEDEIGELSGSLNRLSSKLKNNMSELRDYGEKIKQINMEINKKVFALSSLLQIGNVITTTTEVDEVFNLIIEKLAQLEGAGPTFLMLQDNTSGELKLTNQMNVDVEKMKEIKKGFIHEIFETGNNLVVDKNRKARGTGARLIEILQSKNAALVPVTSAGKVIGVLGTANSSDEYIFADDELELIGVFAKQVTVAIENDTLLHKTEELTVRDELTGLYNESYIRTRLDEEIKRAVSYQRPCAFIIFELDHFQQYHQVLGEIGAEKILKKMSQTVKESTTDIDKAARFSDHLFAVVLPEKNKRQAMAVADNVRKEIERFGLKEKHTEISGSLTVSAGISAAPLDGTAALELVNKALYYKEKAEAEGGDKVVMA